MSDFLLAQEKCSNEVLSQKKGFISWKALKQGNTWVDFVTWETMEDAMAGEDDQGTIPPAAQKFYSFISPESLKSEVFSVEKSYKELCKRGHNKMSNELTSELVKEYGINAGASVVGIATATDFGLAPEGFKPTDALEGCLSVVVLATPFPQEALRKPSIEYTEIRNAMLSHMNAVSKEVAKRIKKAGYNAKAISGVAGKYVNGKLYGHISLKHAAELAGLGVINRNYLLTSLEYGNLLWLSAVLTDASLVPDEKAQYTVCDNCNKCVDACPSNALDNPASFGFEECQKTCWKKIEGKWILVCFMCRKVCPYSFGQNSTLERTKRR